MRQMFSSTFFSLVSIWLFALPASAGIAGKLDPTFGANGKVLHNVSTQGNGASAAAVQSDGKIVFAGEIGHRFALYRLNADGSFDTSFGVNGMARIANFYETFSLTSYAWDLKIQPDGKIVAVGSAERRNFIPQNGPTFSYTAIAVDCRNDVSAVRHYRRQTRTVGFCSLKKVFRTKLNTAGFEQYFGGESLRK